MYKLICCFSFFLSISNCQTSPNSMDTEVFCQHWVHSYEDEDGTGKVYRPSNYAFPPSRGRHGFQLQENGGCIEYAIARADGVEKRMANWEFESKDIVKISYTEENKRALRYKIISIDSTMLKIKILSN